MSFRLVQNSVTSALKVMALLWLCQPGVCLDPIVHVFFDVEW